MGTAPTKEVDEVFVVGTHCCDPVTRFGHGNEWLELTVRKVREDPLLTIWYYIIAPFTLFVNTPIFW